MPEKVVVVGGGQAAASFLARFRQQDQVADVTLISNEGVLPYQRPPLSKKYATGEMQAEQLLLRPQDWYADNNITCMLDTAVTSIETDSHVLNTENAGTVSWDRLLFATGSRPRALPHEIGGGLPGVYLLRSLRDADQFAGELVEGNRVVIIGGGYIGLEAASVCASRGLQVTLVEAADRILQRVACSQTSDWFREIHQQNGVRIIEGTGIQALQAKENRISQVLLANGEKLETDFVLVGIGVVANSELAEAAGLATDGGIVVDEHCRTSNPHMYAAGDCSVFSFRGEVTRIESVQNAIDQAECAADNMAGIERSYEPYPWFWSDQYEVKLQIAGLNRGYNEIVVRPGERDGSISHFYFRDGSFLAVDAINDPRTYMVGKKLLEGGKSITPSQAGDLNLQLKLLLQD